MRFSIRRDRRDREEEAEREGLARPCTCALIGYTVPPPEGVEYERIPDPECPVHGGEAA